MKKIPFNPFRQIHPDLKKELVMEFERFFDRQQYILGDALRRFETAFADYGGVKFAIGTGNGHDALLIILKCLEIGPGDEVIVPAHTFVATALAVVNAGATPVLADIHPHTLTIDPAQLEKCISKKTKAIIPVHLYGNPCDMKAITSIAENHNLHVIEDNAQAQGAVYHSHKTGTFSTMSFTSFYPTKNIGALGDGGMITTDHEELYQKAACLRNYGKAKNGQYSMAGVNSRLDELQAHMLQIKLKHLDAWNNERRTIASWYESELQHLRNHLRMQHSLPETKNARHIFPVITPRRNALQKYLLEKGIDTLVHYDLPIHLHKAFAKLGYIKSNFPIAESICQSELSLPIYPGISLDEVKYICRHINVFFNG